MVPDTVKDDIQAIRDALTGGTLDVNIASGGAGDGAILDGASPSIKATVKDLTNANPLTVAIVDTSGDQIASFGGGTQYTEGDTDATIVGTAIMWEDAGNALTPVSSAKPLPVSASIDPTGLATSAKQDTIIGHVDGIETLLGTIDADTSNISTKIDTIVGHVDGLETLIGTTNTTLTTIDGRVDGIEALLTTIDADTSNLSVVGGGTEATAVRVTIANNSTGVLSIDDNGSTVSIDDGGGVITVDGTVAVTNSDITSIKTAVEILDNAISGSEMQVDLASAIPAGTNAIGKLLAPDIDVTAHTNYAKKFYTSTGAATDGIVWSPAAGKRWHAVVIHFQVSADCTVTLEDDKAGGDEVVWKGEYKAGSGHTLTFSEKYPLASGEDAADLLITTSAGNIYLLAVGYEV